MKLSELLHRCNIEVGSFNDCLISSITTDSRAAVKGSLFVAVKGLHADGHDFIPQVVAAGCAALLVERQVELTTVSPPQIKVKDSRAAVGELAAAFYGYPGSKLNMVGITGTNGKTTCTYLLESIVKQSGGVPGVIGTINYRFKDVEKKAAFTTPEPVELNKILREMLDAGVTHVLMEVSSHALAQKRLQGIFFDAALFCNLTRDHLDFHGSMEEYFNAKKELFTCHLKEDASALIFIENSGDKEEWGDRLVRELQTAGLSSLQTCSLSLGADYYCRQVEHDMYGSVITIKTPRNEIRINTSLVGSFNVKNVIGAVAVARVLRMDDSAIIKGLADLQNVPGRMERVNLGQAEDFAVFVDYAHTPDAMHNVLSTLKELRPERMIVVFGCGGDRDMGKRPLMGEVAGQLADLVIITADNSRSEDLTVIIEQIMVGVEKAHKNRIDDLTDHTGSGYMVISSRKDAIVTVVKAAAKGDVVLVCGKGHETYQINKDGTVFFDDRIEVAGAYALRLL